MICLLLSTYNGEPYLPKLLASLKTQTHTDWKLLIRDDGSSDKTVDIIQEFAHQYANQVFLLPSRSNLGVKKSFSLLLIEALTLSTCNYFMFCDQDDIWLPNKIALTYEKMLHTQAQDSDLPILIHTDLCVVDETLQTINNSFWHYEYIDPKKNSLNRLLLHNTITGCTVMFNRPLAILALPIPDEAIMHDWWLGLVAGHFGKIAFINQPTILYRQHNDNTEGAKAFSIKMVIKKALGLLLTNTLYQTLEKNFLQAEHFLITYEDRLSKEDIKMLRGFIHIKEKPFFARKSHLLKHKLLKHGFLRNLGLLFRI